jgi:hypothetical protein
MESMSSSATSSLRICFDYTCYAAEVDLSKGGHAYAGEATLYRESQDTLLPGMSEPFWVDDHPYKKSPAARHAMIPSAKCTIAA